MDKRVSILGESSSTPADASVLLANCLGVFCPPSHDIEKHSGQTSETWNTYVAQVLLSLIRETWILFLPFLTLLSLLLLHLADEGNILLLLYLWHCPVLSSSGWILPIASQRWKAFLRHRTIGQKDSKKKRTHLRPWLLALHSWPLFMEFNNLHWEGGYGICLAYLGGSKLFPQ